ncbi:MAG: RNA polymerase sigma-70 factor [Bacteroidota bacterium]|nr:RNA polymerase sigma-70 factor [Bacteroidota bacterium]
MTQLKPHKNFTQADLAKVFREYYPGLINFSLSIIGDHDSSKEVVQLVFVNLWDNREKIDMNKSLKSYLFTSVRNRCLNFLRDKKKYNSYILDIEIAGNEVFIDDEDDMSDLKKKIEDALQKLPEKCREIFILSKINGLKYREIADDLNISIKTVENQISKALRILRNELKDKVFIILMIILSMLNGGL